MKNKIIIIIIAALALCAFIGIYQYMKDSDEPSTFKTIPLRDFDQFKKIDPNNIESLSIIKYTEGGDNEKYITDRDEILNTYNSLSNIKVGKETNMVCEDNTTVYVFKMKDKTSVSFEIECDWIILNKKRYLIK